MHMKEGDIREVTLEVECDERSNSAQGKRATRDVMGGTGMRLHNHAAAEQRTHTAQRSAVDAQRTGDACAKMTQDSAWR